MSGGEEVLTLVAPTEPKLFRVLGRTSSLPEKFGADVLMFLDGRKVGVQRKELTDLVASVYDGRLGREFALMKQLESGLLLVEGRPSWTTEGELLHSGQRMTKEQLCNLLYSAQMIHGLYLVWTGSEQDTVDSLLSLRKWLAKKDHRSLIVRPKPPAGVWNTRTSRDWGIYLLQGFPGVGPTLAGALFDHFKSVPLNWAADRRQLMEVEGIGEKRAEELLKSLREVSEK